MKERKNEREYLFCIDVADMLARASALTSVLGASRADGQGTPLYDFLRLTADDAVVVRELLQRSLPELHGRLLAYRLPGGCRCEGVFPSEAGEAGHVDVQLRLPAAAFEAEADVRELLLDYLASSVVSGWLLLKKPDEAAPFGARAAVCLDRLSALLNRRCRPILRRYRWF